MLLLLLFMMRRRLITRLKHAPDQYLTSLLILITISMMYKYLQRELSHRMTSAARDNNTMCIYFGEGLRGEGMLRRNERMATVLWPVGYIYDFFLLRYVDDSYKWFFFFFLSVFSLKYVS